MSNYVLKRIRKSLTPTDPPPVTMAEPAEHTNEVGYCKPPKHSRFKPGQSGNPKGRAKGEKSLRVILRDVLGEIIEVGEKGRNRRKSKLEVLVLQMMNKAMTGDARARADVIKLIEKFHPHVPMNPGSSEGETPEVSAMDLEVIKYLGLEKFIPNNSQQEAEQEEPKKGAINNTTTKGHQK